MSGKYLFRVKDDLTIKTWNANMEKLSCRPAKDIIGQKINNVFPSLCSRIKLVFRDEKRINIENIKVATMYGADFSCCVQISGIKNRMGKVREVSVMFSDLKTRYEPGKRISGSDEKMIEIGKIASSLAHGVRNPLNAIKGAVAYLREKYGHEATLLEFSTIINDEINKLDSFISNFLSAAKGGLKIVPADINDIINRIIVMIKPRAKTQNIHISHNPSELPLIGVDPFQIEQALFNIINNALEAMPKGGNLDIRISST